MTMPATRQVNFDSLHVSFLATLAKDRTAGRVRPLADYLALFPRHEDDIAQAWLGLRAAPQAPESNAVYPSQRVGPYRLIEELGRGGQAVVWLAEDTRVGRVAALKTVPRSPLFGELAPRLEREARALAHLDHAGLGQVYDVGAADGVAWIAMRLERGRTLQDRIASGDCDARPASEVLDWIRRAADALHAAHEAGFLHRDVKPSNLMVRDDGHVVVLDFGVATHDDPAVPLTLTGEVVGTPGYMAPEVLSTGLGPVDRRADVWALGATLYEALAGRRPFADPTREGEARRALRDEPPPIDAARTTGVRRKDLDILLATALSKDSELRYATAGAFSADLASVARGDPLVTRRPSLMRRFSRWAQRRPGLAATLFALVFVLIAALVLFVRSEGQLRDFRRLADLAIAQDLLRSRDSLFPLSPEKAPELELWLSRSEELFSREAVHRATVERLPEIEARLWARGDESGEGWMREQLEELLETIDALRARHAFMEEQARLASSLDRLIAEDHAAAWASARERVTDDRRFSGFTLIPQRGLLPLGPDPRSGLEEFAHLPTGVPARRDPTTGALTVAADTGVVLVLVPFGETLVGASAPEAGLEHPDPRRGQWDGPPQRVRLDPFFVSKYELTQGQWSRHTGSNPSRHRNDERESRYLVGPCELHPLESASYLQVSDALHAMGLQLPTEVQWEHCARAGSTTPWSFGDAAADIEAFGNIADSSVEAIDNEVGWEFEPGIDDGHIAHAPVGSFLPNDWGLHDVHGNVCELTRSTYEDLRLHPPRDGEGETVRNFNLQVYRGGGFNQAAIHARSSFRNGSPPDSKSVSIGARPILRYSP